MRIVLGGKLGHFRCGMTILGIVKRLGTFILAREQGLANEKMKCKQAVTIWRNGHLDQAVRWRRSMPIDGFVLRRWRASQPRSRAHLMTLREPSYLSASPHDEELPEWLLLCCVPRKIVIAF